MEKMTIPNKYFPQTEFNEAEIDILFTKAMRLNNGDQGVGKILTCINNNGLADWIAAPTESVITTYTPPTITPNPALTNVAFSNFNAVRLDNIIKFNFDLSFDFSGFVGVEYDLVFSCPLTTTSFSQNKAVCNFTQKSNGFAVSSARLESNLASTNLTLYINPSASGHTFEISVIGFVEVI